MPVATAIMGIGGSIANGIMGANAASNAASAETTAANAAINQNNQARNAADATQQGVYQQDEQNLAPYQAAGGGVASGGALKAAAQYSQNLASGEYGNAFNRVMQSNAQRFNQLNALAGIGENANQQQLYAGANYANQSGAYGMDTARMNSDLLTQIGNAQAAGTVGQANAYEGMASGIATGATGLKFNSSGMPRAPNLNNVNFGQLNGMAGGNVQDAGQFGALPTAAPYYAGLPGAYTNLNDLGAAAGVPAV